MKSLCESVVAVVVVALFLSGCQLKPTQIKQTSKISGELLVAHPDAPVELTEETIVVDTRSRFEYEMSHIPGALHIRWSDFVAKDDPPSVAIKKLALRGISENSHVVVVGQLPKGNGEDAHVAWWLYYLGLKNIQVANIDNFRSGLTNAEPPARQNQKPWAPKVNSKLIALRPEVLAVATQKVGQKKEVYLLDVRSRKEFFLKRGLGEGYVTPNIGATHIPWDEFYLHDGRVDIAMRRQLEAIGIDPSDRILIISNHGVRSSAVSFALISLGYKNVGNYLGGYDELLDFDKRKEPPERPPGK